MKLIIFLKEMFMQRKTLNCCCLALFLMASIGSFYFIWQLIYLPAGIDSALHVLDRSEWLGEPPKSNYDHLKTPIKNVIICHTATEACESEDVCMYRMRIIQRFHMDSFGWSDIGYNFLVGGDGHVYVGRGWDTQAQHTKGYGATTLSIAFIGTFTQKEPPQSQITAAKRLMAEGVRLRKLHPDYHIYAARQFSATESPGMALYNLMKSWPRWSNDVDDLSRNNNATLKIVGREFWLAQPAQSSLQEIELPAKHVILHSTKTETCHTQAQCTFYVRFLQTFHIESNQQPDIIYNFLVGDDGNVYEGRGWSKLAASEGATNDSISIAYIGSFKRLAASDKQLQTLKLLLNEGVRLGKLVVNYDITDSEELQQQIPKYLHLVAREKWLAQPATEELPIFQFPIEFVYVKPTETGSCSRQEECIAQVHAMQAHDQESISLSDIRYNFLIGDDGNVYEGRGWQKMGSILDENNEELNVTNHLALGLIGTYGKHDASRMQQLLITKALLAEGVRLGKLSANYEIVDTLN